MEENDTLLAFASGEDSISACLISVSSSSEAIIGVCIAKGDEGEAETPVVSSS
jgi:hypothetical protein